MPINVTMPALSPTMTEGTLAKWLVKEGQNIAAGDVIAEIETDKATMEVEAVDEGVLGKILVPAGSEGVPVNQVIAVLLEEGEDAKNIVIPTEAKPKASIAEGSSSSAKARDPSAPAKQSLTAARDDRKGARIFASPLAKRLAAEKGIDLASVQGSGPHGRIVKADLDGASLRIGGATLPQKPSADPRAMLNAYGMEYTEIPHNNIKKVTARRLLEAKQTVPHFYLTIECQIDNLLAARADLNNKAAGAYKLSVNDFIIKAAAMALKVYPAANVSWSDTALLQYKHADISVAVSTPNGLITPIIKRAEEKGMREISEEMKELAARAREGKLKPEEFQGGTFSISNLGMFGVEEFSAIINPPQSCILAVGAGMEKPVVEDGKVQIRTVMKVTLSTDHRSVDGAVGAGYLQIFKKYIENPVSMLL